MALFELHSWIRFGIGLIAGCWIGGTIGFAVAILLAGRRMHTLEAANSALRARLKTREMPRRSGTAGAGPGTASGGGIHRPASAPLKVANGGR